MAVRRPAESVPLLTGRLGTKKPRPKTKSVDDDSDKYWEDWEDSSDTELLADRKRRGTSLIFNDCCLLLLHTLQLYALLQSLSIRWVWPISWLTYSKYMFFVNADAWEYVKFESNVTFKAVQGYYTPTSAMPFQYWHYLMGWAAVIGILLVIYIIIYVVFRIRHHPYMLVHIAKLQRGYITILQLLAVPLGVAMARVFHCYTNTSGDLIMDVANDSKCWEDHHWAYIAPVAVCFLLLYIVFPTWMILRTKQEILNMTSDRHEGYLQLKEVEYVQGMDVMWILNHFHLFSSFKKYGCHFRSVNHIIIGIFVALFAALFQYMFVQILLITLFLLCLMLAYLIIRPYRVRAFNVMLFISLLVLLVDGLLGCLVTTFDSFSVQSVWLTPAYMIVILGLVHGVWLVCAVLFVLYLVLRQFCCRRCIKEPLWPSMTSRSLNKLTPETRTYVKAVLRNRSLTERTLTMPAMFAPAHELTRQIHIVNAYCREAEYLRDPMQDSLWDVLDQLIEVHAQIAPRSLFADSIKESIRRTAGEFMKLMPTFVERLAQREYDLIMVRPFKRRLLLKLYCMGLFLNGRKEKVQRQRMNEPAIQKVWKYKKTDDLEDDGYYEDMYPEAEEGPVFRPQTAIVLEFLSEDEADDELALQRAEKFTLEHPLSQHYTNLAFTMDDDASTVVEDENDLADDSTLPPTRPHTMPLSPGSQSSFRSATIDLPPESHTESRFSLQSSTYPTKDSPSPQPGATNPAGSRLPLTPESAARPGSGNLLRPGSGNSLRPGSGNSLRPGSGNSLRPGSGNSLRPGSGNSPRPGSALTTERATSSTSLKSSGSGSGSRNVTPLPGQLLDQEQPTESKA